MSKHVHICSSPNKTNFGLAIDNNVLANATTTPVKSMLIIFLLFFVHTINFSSFEIVFFNAFFGFKRQSSLYTHKFSFNSMKNDRFNDFLVYILISLKQTTAHIHLHLHTPFRQIGIPFDVCYLFNRLNSLRYSRFNN